MPFTSKKQAKWMFANKPKMAKEWASKTPSIKALPNRVSKDGMMKAEASRRMK